MVCTNQEHAAMLHSIIQGLVSAPEQFITGWVSFVVTHKNEQRINVTRYDRREQVEFKFSPNAAPHQQELIRAQDGGYDMFVAYTLKAGNNVIDRVGLIVSSSPH